MLIMPARQYSITNLGPNTTANFIFVGDYNGGTFYNGGVRGRYWSSMSTNATEARNLRFTTDKVFVAQNNGNLLGIALRCLFRD